MVLSRIILGLLAIAPMTGYDLKRHFDSTVGHFWAADKAQIYRTLAGLVAGGLAEVETVAGAGAPDRQEHHITAAGREALGAWLVSPPERHVERDPFLARVFFGAGLGEDELRALVAGRRAEVEARLAVLEGVRGEAVDRAARLRGEVDDRAGRSRGEAVDRAGRLRLATLELGIAQLRTELGWLDSVEEVR